MVKGLPCNPGRTCLKNTGEPILRRTRIPIRTRRGERIITEGMAIARSKRRLKKGEPETGDWRPEEGEGDLDDILKSFLSDLYKIM
jgi:hypothetical protein